MDLFSKPAWLVINLSFPRIQSSIVSFSSKKESYFNVVTQRAFGEILGSENMLFAEGSLHRYLRNLVMSLVGNENLKVKLLPDVEKMICKHLNYWCGQASVELKEAVAKVNLFRIRSLLVYIM